MNAHPLLLDSLLVCLLNGIRRLVMGLFVYLVFAGTLDLNLGYMADE
jgi:hypothetical protein